MSSVSVSSVLGTVSSSLRYSRMVNAVGERCGMLGDDRVTSSSPGVSLPWRAARPLGVIS